MYGLLLTFVFFFFEFRELLLNTDCIVIESIVAINLNFRLNFNFISEKFLILLS